jgi:hypothetical protein
LYHLRIANARTYLAGVNYYGKIETLQSEYTDLLKGYFKLNEYDEFDRVLVGVARAKAPFRK